MYMYSVSHFIQTQFGKTQQPLHGINKGVKWNSELQSRRAFICRQTAYKNKGAKLVELIYICFTQSIHCTNGNQHKRETVRVIIVLQNYMAEFKD